MTKDQKGFVAVLLVAGIGVFLYLRSRSKKKKLSVLGSSVGAAASSAQVV